MGRNHIAGSHGDAANAILAATNDKFALLLKWLALLRAWITALIEAATTRSSTPQPA